MQLISSTKQMKCQSDEQDGILALLNHIKQSEASGQVKNVLHLCQLPQELDSVLNHTRRTMIILHRT